MEEGGLQQHLDAGHPHPTGRRRGEQDGGVDRGEGQRRGGRGRERRREELVKVTLLRLLSHRSERQERKKRSIKESVSNLNYYIEYFSVLKQVNKGQILWFSTFFFVSSVLTVDRTEETEMFCKGNVLDFIYFYSFFFFKSIKS